MKKIIVKTCINAIAVATVANFFPGIDYQGGIIGLLAIALTFGVINLLVKPIITLLALPLKLITLGLFSLIINGVMLYLTSALLDNFTT